MGKIKHDRKIHYDYDPELIALYNGLPEHTKSEMRAYGKPYGYSGLNIFFISFFMWGMKQYLGYTFEEWITKE